MIICLARPGLRQSDGWAVSAEYWSSWLKLITIGIFLFSALIFVLGGGPSSGSFNSYWGARLYYNPGAFANGFKGVCAVFVTAAFSFAGTFCSCKEEIVV